VKHRKAVYISRNRKIESKRKRASTDILQIYLLDIPRYIYGKGNRKNKIKSKRSERERDRERGRGR